MGGAGRTIEADETYIGRKAESSAFEAPAPKEAVFALVEREGRVRSFHVPNATAQMLRPLIGRHRDLLMEGLVSPGDMTSPCASSSRAKFSAVRRSISKEIRSHPAIHGQGHTLAFRMCSRPVAMTFDIRFSRGPTWRKM
jgi:hypothetical protein